jgi:hypothetical protein
MFTDSIAWLHRAIDDMREKRRLKNTLLAEIEAVIEIADPLIRLASGYRHRLLPSLAVAAAYCNDLVAQIPGPVLLQPKKYADNPLIKALFLTTEEVESVLRQVRNADIPGSEPEVYALLTMSRTTKTVYGHKQEGEMTLRDVPMQAVTFVDHRLVQPAASLETARSQLGRRSLELLAIAAMEKISALKANLAELRERRERLVSMHRILCGKRQTFEILCQPDQEHAEKIRELKTLLAETDEQIEQARKELEPPNDTLAHLKRTLDLPAEVLVLQRRSQHLNWMNVIVDSSEESEANDIELAEITFSKELQRSALLVSLSRQDLT